jgi:hypothetical protein
MEEVYERRTPAGGLFAARAKTRLDYSLSPLFVFTAYPGDILWDGVRKHS